MLEEMEPSQEYGNVRVVGLYGIRGIGKSIISKVFCNQMFKDFDGKTCYTELGSMKQIELQKIVLQELTEANSQI